MMCLSNLKQIGLAMNICANQSKGCVLPTIVWKGLNSNDDAWPLLLISQGLMPDPHAPASIDTASIGTMVCPEVRDVVFNNNLGSPPKPLILV
jgi:hypothetical protein